MKKILLLSCTSMAIFNSQPNFADLAGLFFNVTSQFNVLTINTTIPNHFYPYAGIKINTPGFALANPNIDCVMNENGYCLFSVSDKLTKSISILGNGRLGIILCLNGKAALSCQHYDNISISQPSPPPPPPSPPPPPPPSLSFAYVSNFSANHCVR